MKILHNFKIHAPNVSSRFSEYVFQYARMHSTNSPLFDIAGFRRHLKHLIGQMKLVATTGLKVLAARRGVPHDVRHEGVEQFKAPDGWHLTDEELVQAIDHEIAECAQFWINVLGCDDLLDLSKPDHFFVNPAKHFPHGDMFAQGVDDPWYQDNAGNQQGPEPNNQHDAAANPQEREDPGWNHDGDDAGADNQDAGAAADASQDMVDQWSNLMQQQGLVGAEAEAPASKIALLQQLSQPLSDWNSKYVRPKADRVYGRMEGQAFRENVRSKDDKWEWLSGDDDVAFVYSIDQRDYIRIGNVIDTAILKAPPRARKTKLTDVDLMQKDPKARVPLNVEKGAIWIRKYKEATKAGIALENYQNSSRGKNAYKHYTLPQSSGEPLEWWPITSVLGHVRMSRVENIDVLCYNRNNSDYKDLLAKYHKELEESGEVCRCRVCKR